VERLSRCRGRGWTVPVALVRPVPKIADTSGLAGINDKLAAADLTENSRHGEPVRARRKTR
jgi:hypothetical protein